MKITKCPSADLVMFAENPVEYDALLEKVKENFPRAFMAAPTDNNRFYLIEGKWIEIRKAVTPKPIARPPTPPPPPATAMATTPGKIVIVPGEPVK